jgi:hypothetical protein
MIEVSVTIPLLRSKYIAWLCFEGLARQQGINFEWEIVVAEEIKPEDNDLPFGKEAVMQYKERLLDVGCTKINYYGLEKWMPLADKQRFLIEKCAESSTLIMGSSDDYFSPPRRLKTLYDLHIKNPDADWFTMANDILYDIPTGKAVCRKTESITNTAGLAIRASTLRKASVFIRDKYKGADRLRFESCKRVRGKEFKVIRDKSDIWKYGLNTNGLNCISLSRNKWFINKRDLHPLREIYKEDLSKTIPEDILERLKECALLIPFYQKNQKDIKRIDKLRRAALKKARAKAKSTQIPELDQAKVRESARLKRAKKKLIQAKKKKKTK